MSASEIQPIRRCSYVLRTTLSCSFVGALLTRFFLGFVEAAFFPGALFLLSKWYKRSELGQRTAFLSCGSLISNAFGSLMASGILDGMDGMLGRAAWRQVVQTLLDSSYVMICRLASRWLFFIEGSLTILASFILFYNSVRVTLTPRISL